MGKKKAEAKPIEGSRAAKADPPKKRARGHRQRGAGAVRTARAAVERGGTLVEQWQRLPSQLLQEFCQRDRRPRPRYQSQRGSRMKVVVPDAKKSDRDLHFLPEQSFDDETLGKEYAALLALSHLQGSLPLERKLPEPYKTTWLQTIEAKSGAPRAEEEQAAPKLSKAAQKRLAAEEKRKKAAEERKAKANAPKSVKVDDRPDAALPGAPTNENGTLLEPAKSSNGDTGDSEVVTKTSAIPSAVGPLTSARRHLSAAEEKEERDQKRERAIQRKRRRDAFQAANKDMKVSMSKGLRRLLEALLALNLTESAQAVLSGFEIAGNNDEDEVRSQEVALEELSPDQQVAYEELLQLGFEPGDIVRALSRTANRSAGLGDQGEGSKRLSSVGQRGLDWLLLYLPEDDLPRGFETKEAVKVVQSSKPAATTRQDPSENQIDGQSAMPSAHREELNRRYGFPFDWIDEADAVNKHMHQNDASEQYGVCRLVVLGLILRDPNSSAVENGSDTAAKILRTEPAAVGGLDCWKEELDALCSILEEPENRFRLLVHHGSGRDNVSTFCASEGGFDWEGVEASDGFDPQTAALVASIEMPGFELSPSSGNCSTASWRLTFAFAPGAVAGYPASLLVPMLENPFDEEYKDSALLLNAQRLIARKSFAAYEQHSPALYDVWSYTEGELLEDLNSKEVSASSPRYALRLRDLVKPLLTSRGETYERLSGPPSVHDPQKGNLSRKNSSVAKKKRSGRTMPGRRYHDAFFDSPPCQKTSALYEKRKRWLRSAAGGAISTVRSNLPSAKTKDTFLSALAMNQVIIVSGETGCGKTTQIPQFILEEADDYAELSSEVGRGRAFAKIVCTQPRRLAATGVAQRVSEERTGESPCCDSEVGYKIRGDSSAGSNTRLLFCTTGILLRRLQDDPLIRNVTHVIVDEVHERTLDGDFLLVLLKELLPKRPELKVVLMSATIDADKIANYFGSFPSQDSVSKGASSGACPTLFIPGFTYPVSELYLDDLMSSIYYQPKLRKKGQAEERDGPVAQAVDDEGEAQDDGVGSGDDVGDIVDKVKAEEAGADGGEGEILDEDVEDWEIQDPAEEDEKPGCTPKQNLRLANIGRVDEHVLYTDYTLICHAVAWALQGFPVADEGRRQTRKGGSSLPSDGAVLVFLPGVGEVMRCVRMLEERLNSGEHVGGITGDPIGPTLVLPLHGSLNGNDQRRVFRAAPRGTRKIVVATNIAETSITIPDVTVVIDTGRVKQTGFDPARNMSSLTVHWCAQDACRQRRGRAGRVRDGVCLRLFTRHKWKVLSKATTPEMLRTPLESLVLQLRVMGYTPAYQFLRKTLDPPALSAIEAAERRLARLGAVQLASDGRSMNVETTSFHALSGLELTPLGRHLAQIPADVAIAKMLVYGALLGCIEPILTVAAALAMRSPFQSGPEGMSDEQRRRFATIGGGCSDHLAIAAAYVEYIAQVKAKGRGAARRWCMDVGINGARMEDVSETRRQFRDSLQQIGFLQSARAGADLSTHLGHGTNQVLRAALVAGLYPNVFRVVKSPQKYQETVAGAVEKLRDAKEMQFFVKTEQQPIRASAEDPENWNVCDLIEQLQRVDIHPGSVMFHERVWSSQWVVYHELAKTSKTFVRDCTLVKPLSLLLFGGDLVVQPLNNTITVDGWIRVQASPRVGALVKELRRRMDEALEQKLRDVSFDVYSSPVMQGVVKLLNADGLM